MKDLLSVFAFLLVTLLLSCKTPNNEINKDNQKLVNSNYYNGRITTVGNEPFTKLGLIINDSTIYILKCDNNTQNKLMMNQGKSFKVFYDNKIDSIGTTVLNVIKIEEE